LILRIPGSESATES